MKLLFKKMWGFGEDGEKKRRLNETKGLKWKWEKQKKRLLELVLNIFEMSESGLRIREIKGEYFIFKITYRSTLKVNTVRVFQMWPDLEYRISIQLHMKCSTPISHTGFSIYFIGLLKFIFHFKKTVYSK
jgi:hypothetical protein